eukprot:TRINITY_DN1033_c0_g1_i1.p1 TRINITY_DN1033_c0_g1~~TRINITY_DN1033_c0_g1_i1.p1  ORF type:complete len:135 (+),score=33.48 TRINITY_DN1033_c0_g1_i1:27-407(+)
MSFPLRARALASCMRLRAAEKAPSPKGAKKKAAAAASSAPAAASVAIDVRRKHIVGANTKKEGTDPEVLDDAAYPEWLWGLLDKRPTLSELKRKKITDMSMPELERLVKLDNRDKIKSNNLDKAKS